MNTRTVTIPELAMIAGTRAALGAGIGFLLADRFCPQTRRTIGWTLLAVGALSTIPLVAELMLQGERPRPAADDMASRSRERDMADIAHV